MFLVLSRAWKKWWLVLLTGFSPKDFFSFCILFVLLCASSRRLFALVLFFSFHFVFLPSVYVAGLVIPVLLPKDSQFLDANLVCITDMIRRNWAETRHTDNGLIIFHIDSAFVFCSLLFPIFPGRKLCGKIEISKWETNTSTDDDSIFSQNINTIMMIRTFSFARARKRGIECWRTHCFCN